MIASLVDSSQHFAINIFHNNDNSRSYYHNNTHPILVQTSLTNFQSHLAMKSTSYHLQTKCHIQITRDTIDCIISGLISTFCNHSHNSKNTHPSSVQTSLTNSQSHLAMKSTHYHLQTKFQIQITRDTIDSVISEHFATNTIHNNSIKMHAIQTTLTQS